LATSAAEGNEGFNRELKRGSPNALEMALKWESFADESPVRCNKKMNWTIM
jgi:hypothetical protein